MDEEDRKSRFTGSRESGPIIINGPVLRDPENREKPIKSINQFYNKKRAEIQEKLSSTTNQRSSKELREITDWRNEKINDYMHKASRFVINHCKAFNIGHIVIGKNDGWKQEINIGKRNNQNFVFIPFNRLIQQIQLNAVVQPLSPQSKIGWHRSNNHRRRLHKQMLCS